MHSVGSSIFFDKNTKKYFVTRNINYKDDNGERTKYVRQLIN